MNAPPNGPPPGGYGYGDPSKAPLPLSPFRTPAPPGPPPPPPNRGRAWIGGVPIIGLLVFGSRVLRLCGSHSAYDGYQYVPELSFNTPDRASDLANAAPLGVIETKLQAQDFIAVDDKQVYVMSEQGTLTAQAKSGGGKLLVLAQGEKNVGGIAVDAKYVYWTSRGEASNGGAVRKVAKAGGAEVATVANVTYAERIAVDDQAVYVTLGTDRAGSSHAVLMRLPLKGGAWTTLAENSYRATSLLLGATQAYFTENDGLWVVDKDGGRGSRVGVGAVGPFEVARSGDTFFWIADEEIWKLPSGKDKEPVVVAKEQSEPIQIAADAKTVCWVSGADAEGASLRCMPKAASKVAIVAKDVPGYVMSNLAVDDGRVYWSSNGNAFWASTTASKPEAKKLSGK